MGDSGIADSGIADSGIADSAIGDSGIGDPGLVISDEGFSCRWPITILGVSLLTHRQRQTGPRG